MKELRLILILLILFNTDSCIINYVPKISDYSETLVVDGLITDQPGINTIKISRSQPMWSGQYPKPLTGCIVSISDDMDKIYPLTEKTSSFGIYITDPAGFRGVPGRVYTLHIRTTQEPVNLSYESLPMKMIPVPPIDTLYYEKKIFTQYEKPIEGCNIYLDTHDPSNNCRFFRWEYSETWEFHSPFKFVDPLNVDTTRRDKCWISNKPADILIKNASLFAETNIIRNTLASIKNPGDRFTVKYSILVNQFSLNEDEYYYWEKLKNSIDQTGGLYDAIPAAIPNNIYCIEDPSRKVLGYLSVSAISSKRIFIRENFNIINDLSKCIGDIIYTSRPDTIQDIFILNNHSHDSPPYIVFTRDRACVDCTMKGSNIKPAFWDDDK